MLPAAVIRVICQIKKPRALAAGPSTSISGLCDKEKGTKSSIRFKSTATGRLRLVSRITFLGLGPKSHVLRRHIATWGS